MIIAYAYDSEAMAKYQLNAYRLWAARALPGPAPAWRIRTLEGRHAVVAL